MRLENESKKNQRQNKVERLLDKGLDCIWWPEYCEREGEEGGKCKGVEKCDSEVKVKRSEEEIGKKLIFL